MDLKTDFSQSGGIGVIEKGKSSEVGRLSSVRGMCFGM